MALKASGVFWGLSRHGYNCWDAGDRPARRGDAGGGRRRRSLMLYDPARHEALQGGEWSADSARETIERIVGETEARCSPETWWPVHPRDVEPGDAPVPSTTLHFGAAGVVWAIEQLTGEPRGDLEALLVG